MLKQQLFSGKPQHLVRQILLPFRHGAIFGRHKSTIVFNNIYSFGKHFGTGNLIVLRSFAQGADHL